MAASRGAIITARTIAAAAIACPGENFAMVGMNNEPEAVAIWCGPQGVLVRCCKNGTSTVAPQ